MKRFLVTLFACLAIGAAVPVLQSGCTTSATTQNQVVQTLKAVGQSAEAAVALSTQLYQAKTITLEQKRQVNDFFDAKFMPVYRVAVTAAKSDLSSIASPDLISLAAQLSALVISFQTKTPIQ